jgi:hypothetical protein
VQKSLQVITAVALAAALAVTAYIAVAKLLRIDTSAQSREPSASIDVQDRVTVMENTTDGQSAMLARGNIAMGFDQNKIMHHFMATPTGGQIMIVALDSNDNGTISQIRAHVLDIQQEFSQGDFTKPFFIHAQEVPGTKVMEEKKDLIKYSVQDLDDGAVLVLSTDDGELLQAMQEFMAFQGGEHQGH